MAIITERDKAGRPKYGCPSVTTVIDLLDKPALKFWYAEQGKAIERGEISSLFEKRDDAADAGTYAHALVEAELKGLPTPEPNGLASELISKAEGCYLAWLEWARTHQFKVVESEIMLVHDELGYGGTIDIASILGDLAIVDIKTSKDVYLGHRIQVAAYGALWDANFPANPIKGFRVLRLGPDGSFTDHYWPSLESEWTIFQHLLEIKKVLAANKFKL